MKYIHSPSEVPTAPHLGAFIFGSVYIPGDERSRTNPGHGYPASTESTIKYIVFADGSEAEKWVGEQENRKYGSPDPYLIVEVTTRAVKTTHKII